MSVATMDEYRPGDTAREAERLVLGSVLLSELALDDVAVLLSPQDFWAPAHERIFTSMLRVRSMGHPLDTITVADDLGADLARVGGLPYLHELAGCVAVASSAGHYADVVRRASMHRRVIATGNRLAALPATDDPLDMVNDARRELDDLVTGDSDTTHTDDLYAALESLEDDTPFTPTPWSDLSEAIGGWRPGCLYYLGARPGVGKSALGVQAAIDVARRGKHAHIASLEMSKTEIYHRMLSSVGQVDQDRIQKRRLQDGDWKSVARAAKHIEALPLSVDDRGSQRVVDIRAKARALARTTDLGLIVVDYLQLMKSGQRVENRQQEVSDFSRSLKLLAKELHVPVLALSQLNRGSEHRLDKRPGLIDLRESGSLEQDGDVVLLLHRDPEAPLEVEVLVAKNRHGQADRVVTLGWEGRYSRAVDNKWGNTHGTTNTTNEGSPSYLKD